MSGELNRSRMETDAIGDALRIVERVDMDEVEGELKYQSETVREKVGMFRERFVKT